MLAGKIAEALVKENAGKESTSVKKVGNAGISEISALILDVTPPITTRACHANGVHTTRSDSLCVSQPDSGAGSHYSSHYSDRDDVGSYNPSSDNSIPVDFQNIIKEKHEKNQGKLKTLKNIAYGSMLLLIVYIWSMMTNGCGIAARSTIRNAARQKEKMSRSAAA